MYLFSALAISLVARLATADCPYAHVDRTVQPNKAQEHSARSAVEGKKGIMYSMKPQALNLSPCHKRML